MTNPDRDGKIFVGKSATDEFLTLALANRHGLATGATGTGKTVTLQVLAEGFSRAGVPVFAADIKGDLSGIAARGEAKPELVKRAKEVGFDYEAEEFPVIFWDLFGEQGHPIRATIFEMGPLLVSRMLSLNDVQEGIINIAFRYADDDPDLKAVDGTGLIDLKDLRELLSYLSKNSKEIGTRYGNVASTAVGAVQRQLLVLENQGGTKFFGEPALSIPDLMQTAPNGRGYINVSGRRQADVEPAALRHVFVVAALGLVRKTARGRRSAEAEARFLFRRGTSSFQRGAEGTARQGGAGGAPDPLQGSGSLFRHAKSDRRTGQGFGAAWQPRAARLARLHAERSEGGQSGSGYVPAEPQAQHRAGHHPAWQG